MQKLNISSVALETYRKEAKNYNDLDRNILELKLTAIANNSEKLGQIGRCRVYKFGSFVMLIDESRLRVETVAWRNELHKGYRMSKEIQSKLKEDYKALGLNSNGNTLVE